MPLLAFCSGFGSWCFPVSASEIEREREKAKTHWFTAQHCISGRPMEMWMNEIGNFGENFLVRSCSQPVCSSRAIVGKQCGWYDASTAWPIPSVHHISKWLIRIEVKNIHDCHRFFLPCVVSGEKFVRHKHWECVWWCDPMLKHARVTCYFIVASLFLVRQYQISIIHFFRPIIYSI